MKKSILFIFLGLTFAFQTTSLKAQAVEIHGKPNVWFLLLNHYKVTPKLRIGNEFHIRRDDWLKDQQQLLIRPYLDYKLHEKFHVTAGYTYIRTSPYGKYPLLIPQPEHNVWEQFVINNKIEKNEISHRFRIEHRFRGRIETSRAGEGFIGGFSFTNRFRYRLTYKRPLSELLFVNVFDELWVNQSNRFQIQSFDRNWFYAGLGMNFLETGNVQLAYLHQWAQNNPTRFEQHQSIQVTVQYDFN